MKKRAIIGIWGAVPIMLYAEKGITKNEIVVYGALSSLQGKKDHCWASLEEISKRAFIPATRVSTSISKLVKRGWVLRKRRGKCLTNNYVCLFDVEIEDNDFTETGKSLKSDFTEMGNSDFTKTVKNDFTKTVKSNINNNINNNNIKQQYKEKPAFAQSADCDSDCSKEIIPLNGKDNKQALRKFIHGWFRENNESYHASKKEIGAVENIMKRFNSLDEVRALLEKFKDIIETAKEPFWANKPLIPSQFLCSVDFVISFKSHSKRSRVPNNAEIAEIFDENKRLYEKLKGEGDDF